MLILAIIAGLIGGLIGGAYIEYRWYPFTLIKGPREGKTLHDVEMERDSI